MINLHKKCKEREQRLEDELDIQEVKHKEVLNRRVAQLNEVIVSLGLERQKSWHVDPDYVFAISKNGNILLNGQQITTPELKNLKSEVRALKEFQIWKVIQSTLRQKAIEKAILNSTDLYSLQGNEQVLAGKMMVYSLDIIKTIIANVDSSKIK